MREDVENAFLLDELGEAAPIYNVDRDSKFLTCSVYEDGKPVIRWFERMGHATIFMPLSSVGELRSAVVACLLEAASWNPVFSGSTKEDLNRDLRPEDPYSTLSAPGERPPFSLERDYVHKDVPPGKTVYVGKPEFVGRAAVRRSGEERSYGVLLYNPRLVRASSP